MGKIEIKTILIWLGLFILSAFTINLFYREITYWNHWFQTAAILSTLTCLYSYAFIFGFGANNNLFNTAFFIGAVIPVNILMVYPGAQNLYPGFSDGNFIFFLLALELIHGIGFYLMKLTIIQKLRLKND